MSKVSATVEIDLINEFWHQHRINASVSAKDHIRAGSAYIAFGVKLGSGCKISSIEKSMRELAETISDHRREPTLIRLRQLPLQLEVPNPKFEPLYLPRDLVTQPHAMTLGLSYNYSGPVVEFADFNRYPHCLIAGQTGSGKSVLLVNGLYSLLMATPPDELDLVLIDLKNEDLQPFLDMPHVVFAANDLESAEAAIMYVHEEKDRRVKAGRGQFRRTLLVIDELAELARVPNALNLLGSILMLGRSKHVNVVAAIQNPLASIIGSKNKGQFTLKLVGKMATDNDAKTAAGQAHTGAEFLPGRGAFLFVDGAAVRRFQSYFTTDPFATVLAVKDKWYKGQLPLLVLEKTNHD